MVLEEFQEIIQLMHGVVYLAEEVAAVITFHVPVVVVTIPLQLSELVEVVAMEQLELFGQVLLVHSLQLT